MKLRITFTSGIPSFEVETQHTSVREYLDAVHGGAVGLANLGGTIEVLEETVEVSIPKKSRKKELDDAVEITQTT